VVLIGSVAGQFYSFDAKSGRSRLGYVVNYPITDSAAVRGDTAYFTDAQGYFTAMNVKDKNWLWENKIRTYWNIFHAYGIAPSSPKPSGFLWDVYLGFGMPQGSSIALAGDSAYFGANDNMVSLDLNKRAIQWTFQTGGNVLSSPAVAGSAIYFGGEDGYVYALDRTSGTKLWDVTLGGATQSSPAIADGMLYIGCDDGKLYAFK
jgi:outer membrane protein assembly factor BamB